MHEPGLAVGVVEHLAERARGADVIGLDDADETELALTEVELAPALLVDPHVDDPIGERRIDEPAETVVGLVVVMVGVDHPVPEVDVTEDRS